MDDVFKIGLIVMLICFASALALWDPESILDNGSSVTSKTSGEVKIQLNVSSVDWAVMMPGKSQTRGVLVTNIGEKKAILSVAAQNWDPLAAAQFMNFSWDVSSAEALQPGANREIVFRLEISPLIKDITKFSFLIVVYAQEVKV